MRVLGVVPARGGSKGVPRKNIATMLGRPLLQYTAEAALASRLLTHVVLSTDDEEIAAAGRRCGLDVPFMRPAELAQDATPTLPVLLHALALMEDTHGRFDAVFILQPTNALRETSDIDGSIELLARTGADSVISVTEVGERHPARMKVLDGEGRLLDPPFAEAFEGQRRQELPPLYVRDGAVYLTRRDVLVDQRSIKGRDCRAWIIPPERAWGVDTPLDLFIMEQLLRRRAGIIG